MRVVVQCPAECDEEEHEFEVEPEGHPHLHHVVGFHGGVDEGDVLPCGHVMTKKDEEDFIEKVCAALSDRENDWPDFDDD